MGRVRSYAGRSLVRTFDRGLAVGARLDPHLFFLDSAADALEFYRGVFGGSVMTRTFADLGFEDTADTDRLAHGRLDTPLGLSLVCVDTAAGAAYEPGRSVAIGLHHDDPAEIRRWFTALSQQGRVSVALEETGGTFGHLIDRFGVAWLVNEPDA